MRTSLAAALLALLSAAVAMSGCGGGDGTTASSSTTTAGAVGAGTAMAVPGREPEVRGVVAAVRTDAGVDEHRLTDSSNPYYEGMSLLRGEPVILDPETGDVLDVSELDDGAEVQVWVTGGCLESHPVQCTVEAVGVSSPGSQRSR